MKHLKTAVTLVLFIAITLIGLQVIANSKTNQIYKKDAAELNHFKYGLFSVDAWKQQLSIIITDEIDNLYLTRRNEKNLKSHLENQLEILIDKIYDRIKKKNNESSNGRIKQSLIDTFVDVKEIKEGIPEYSEAMLKEMSNPKTETQIKDMLKSRITSYMKETFDTLPDTEKSRIIKRYGAENEEEVKVMLANMITQKHNVITEQALLMIVIAVLIFLIEGFNRGPLPQAQYILLTMTLVVLLIVGVTIPMIDMEAKIAHLSFVLFKHPVKFENQVLYFQSKSIMDVFNIMIYHKEIQMKLVGVLMIGFSVVFPVLKMISSLLYYYDYCRARTFKIIQFFVLKSGKWSMADVLVVAIFMSYIGFNGIINSQLGNLSSSAGELDVLTTNGTSLQPGFYLFFTYAVLAMFLSGYLHSRPYECKKS